MRLNHRPHLRTRRETWRSVLRRTFLGFHALVVRWVLSPLSLSRQSRVLFPLICASFPSQKNSDCMVMFCRCRTRNGGSLLIDLGGRFATLPHDDAATCCAEFRDGINLEQGRKQTARA